MGTAVVATAHVSELSALIDKLKKLPIGESRYFLLQRPDAITYWQKEYPGAAEVKKYSYGRLFGKDGEIRWRKTACGYSLLWLSEGDSPEGFTRLEGEWETSAPQDVFLLGGGDTTQWRDTRIPRKLDYPIDPCQFPSVKVIQYKELNSQTIRFTRYTGFVDQQGA